VNQYRDFDFLWHASLLAPDKVQLKDPQVKAPSHISHEMTDRKMNLRQKKYTQKFPNGTHNRAKQGRSLSLFAIRLLMPAHTSGWYWSLLWW